MAENRSKTTLKTVKEVAGNFEKRFTAIKGLVADQNLRMEKHLAQMLEAIRLLSGTNASSGEAQRSDRSSPSLVATPDGSYPTSDREKLVRSGTVNTYTGLTCLDKIDFPRFDGDKIREWLFKVEEFFEVAGTPNGLKVGLASAHFDGHAAKWHQSLVQTGQFGHLLTDWSAYKVLLKEKFENVFEDPIAELKQLQETEGIVAYHEKFELIMTRVNLPEEYLVSMYLDGLQIDTQINVRMFQPQTVSQCLLIGRLYEQAHPKMVSKQSWSGSKWSGYDNELKGLLDCEEDQLSRDDNKLINIEVTVSTDLLLSEERDSSPQIATGYELETGEKDTDEDRVPSDSNLVVNEVEKVKKYLVAIDVDGETHTTIDHNQLIQEANNHSTDSVQETRLLHHKNSLLKHQVPISHWEFSHRSPIECLDVYDDWPSAIVRTHQSLSNFDLEYAAINAYQVCDLMSLGTKLLTNGRRKTFLKTWRFKFKDTAQPRELIQETLCVHEANETMNQLMLPMHLGSHKGQQKKPSKSPKSWKFKFKSEKLRKMEVKVLDNREVVVGVVGIRQVTSVTKPVTIKQQRGLLGLSGYYRRLVQHFGSIVSLLYALSKKDSFIWSLQAQEAVDELKQALSRVEGSEVLHRAMTVVECDLSKEIQAGYETYDAVKAIIADLKHNSKAKKHYSWGQNVLRKSKIVVPQITQLKDTILQWLHCSGSSGHSGRDATLIQEKLLKEPEKVLDRKMVNRQGKAATKVLVKRTNGPEEEAIWEFLLDLQMCFPE